MLDSKFYKWCHAHRHPIFMVGLLSFFILPEIIEKVFFIKVRFPIIIALLVFSSILIIHTTKKRRTLAYSFAMILFFLIAIWGIYESAKELEIVSISLLFIYFSFITYYLFQDILQPKEVTSSVIFGAFSGYFLIGVLFAFVLILLSNAYSDTTNIDMLGKDANEHILYFSFITLTTIGYGDFAPISTLGQKIAILEGLIGQFYIAGVMAIIVGKFLSSKQKSKE